jgi:hypothetical protein
MGSILLENVKFNILYYKYIYKMGRKQKELKMDRELIVQRLVKMRVEQSASTMTILRFLMDEVGLCRSQSYEILRDVQNWITDHNVIDIKGAVADQLARLDDLYEKGDSKLRLEVLKEVSKLLGLYATQKVDLTSGGNPIGEIKLIKVNDRQIEGN